MPRSEYARKDLGRGLRNLHRYWRLSLPSKVKYADRLIKFVLSRHHSPVPCWSGGKDSTVLLHLVLRHDHEIPVIFNDTGVEFPETLEFVRSLASEWKLNLHYARPEPEESFWRCVETYGWPLFGKSTAQCVEKARRSGNIRVAMSPFERVMAEKGIKISSKCCDFTRERPTKRVESELGADVKFLGLMAAESRSRIRLFVDHGSYYEVKRYYGRGRNIWKANPLAIWAERDIWEYHSLHEIPHCSLYDMGHRRNGCWPCGMGARHGQFMRLRLSHPKLFRHLVLNTSLGGEFVKAKLALADSEYTLGNDLAGLLAVRPCFFDKF